MGVAICLKKCCLDCESSEITVRDYKTSFGGGTSAIIYCEREKICKFLAKNKDQPTIYDMHQDENLY